MVVAISRRCSKKTSTQLRVEGAFAPVQIRALSPCSSTPLRNPLALWDLGNRHKCRGYFDRKWKDAPPLSHWGPPWLGVREWAASLPQVSAPHPAGSVWPHKPGCRRIGSLVNAGKANNFNENKYNRYHRNTIQNTTELQGRSDASHHGILASFPQQSFEWTSKAQNSKFPTREGTEPRSKNPPSFELLPLPDEWLWGDFASCSVPHAQGSGAPHPAVACDVISDSYSSKAQSNAGLYRNHCECEATIMSLVFKANSEESGDIEAAPHPHSILTCPGAILCGHMVPWLALAGRELHSSPGEAAPGNPSKWRPQAELSLCKAYLGNKMTNVFAKRIMSQGSLWWTSTSDQLFCSSPWPTRTHSSSHTGGQGHRVYIWDF